MFLISLVVFSAASLLVGAAQTPWWLIGARALQGVGAAVLAPVALSLLTRGFAEGRARNRAMAACSAVAGLGAAFGLVVGGLVADLISWRAGFFLNVPIGIAMMVLAARFLPDTVRRRGRFGAAGASPATPGSTALVLGIVNAAESGWSAPATPIPLRAAAVMLELFVRMEQRAAQPIVPLRLFAALPVVLIGAGQGLALAPLTSSGVDGVAPADAGVGSGLVTTRPHELHNLTARDSRPR